MSISGPSLRRSALALLATASMAAVSASAFAQVFPQPDRAYEGRVRFSSAAPRQPIHAGEPVVVSGEGFRPGQSVRLAHGTTVIGSALRADEEGRFESRFDLPADAAVGLHPLIVTTEAPYNAAIVELKVSPDVPLSGQERFEIDAAQLVPGLYQSAYSARNGAVFVTSAVGRPPVRQSELLRLDAETLEIEARVTPAAAPPRQGRDGTPQDGGVYAVYGVGVDDVNDTVWVTNSRQNTVAVYRQSDLGLIHQFEPGTVNHARDVVVDQALGKVYASATFAPEVVVLDARSHQVRSRVEITSGVRGETFSAASLSLNPDAHRLYVVSNSTNEVAVIDTATDTVLNVFPVPGARGAIGVSHDPATNRILVAAQGGDNLIALDGASGDVVFDTPVGAGALNVAFEPQSRLAYVTNRGASTVTVVNDQGEIVANLGPAPLANHVALDGQGGVYVVNKSSGSDDPDRDRILHIRPGA